MNEQDEARLKLLQAKVVEYLDLVINAESFVAETASGILFDEAAIGEWQARAQAEVLRVLRNLGWTITDEDGVVDFRPPAGFVPTLEVLRAEQAEKEKLHSPNNSQPKFKHHDWVLFNGDLCAVEVVHQVKAEGSPAPEFYYNIYRSGSDAKYLAMIPEAHLRLAGVETVRNPRLAPLNVVAPTVYLYTDGGASPTNPGWGGWGAVATFDEDNGSEVLGEWHNPERIAGVTNQQMEILAATMGLRGLEKWIADNHSIKEVEVFTDSSYVAETMLGNWQRKANTQWWKGLDQAVAAIGVPVGWNWIGKDTNEYNKIAHDLSQKVR